MPVIMFRAQDLNAFPGHFSNADTELFSHGEDVCFAKKQLAVDHFSHMDDPFHVQNAKASNAFVTFCHEYG